MKEIGGYIELDAYTGKMLHDDGIKLNCGRNALAYLIKARKINKLYMPKLMCDSCDRILDDNEVEVVYYHVGRDFKPLLTEWDGWLYVVNFYGQLSNEYLTTLGTNIIVDNAQAYFQEPISEIDTIYTCRKFFGVADGAVLYTNKKITNNFQRDESFERMHFLLGRFERPATEFYKEYVENNKLFSTQSIKQMSKLTENFLHGLDYEAICKKRNENFEYLHSRLSISNRLKLNVPEGAFMYPYYVDHGKEVRKKLQEKKIYIPILWPAVFKRCKEDEIEYEMAMNILPIPVDQRYEINDMEYIVNEMEKIISSNLTNY